MSVPELVYGFFLPRGGAVIEVRPYGFSLGPAEDAETEFGLEKAIMYYSLTTRKEGGWKQSEREQMVAQVRASDRLQEFGHLSSDSQFCPFILL
jgi:hypothetical protein